MKYARHLYLSKGLEKKRDKILERLEEGKFRRSLYLLILSDNEESHLEIYNSLLFCQPAFPYENFFVVGIANGYDDAIELVEQIAKEVYNETKGTDLRSYILEREQEE